MLTFNIFLLILIFIPQIAVTHLSSHIFINGLECIQDNALFIDAEKGVFFLCSSVMFTIRSDIWPLHRLPPYKRPLSSSEWESPLDVSWNWQPNSCGLTAPDILSLYLSACIAWPKMQCWMLSRCRCATLGLDAERIFIVCFCQAQSWQLLNWGIHCKLCYSSMGDCTLPTQQDFLSVWERMRWISAIDFLNFIWQDLLKLFLQTSRACCGC